MIDFKNIEDVKRVQQAIRGVYDGPHGKDAMKFMEQICGWFDFQETDKDIILMQHGKRQVLATIKTFLTLNPEQIVALAKKENDV